MTSEPPEGVRYSLEEALELLADLEDARAVLEHTDHLALLAQIVHQGLLLARKLGFDEPHRGP